jgi:hypothetical protein
MENSLLIAEMKKYIDENPKVVPLINEKKYPKAEFRQMMMNLLEYNIETTYREVD